MKERKKKNKKIKIKHCKIVATEKSHRMYCVKTEMFNLVLLCDLLFKEKGML